MNSKIISYTRMIFMVKKIPTANFILRGKSEKYTKENMCVVALISQIMVFSINYASIIR